MYQLLSKRINTYLKNPIFWPIFIFFSAAFFRIFYMDLIEFKGDEAYAAYQIQNFFLNPKILTDSALSTTGIRYPPLSLFILIIFGIFSRDPQFLSFSIAFFNSVFIVIFYLLIKRSFGNSIGILASILLAFSPWSILFSRKIWGPDYIFFFSLPLYYFLYKLIVKKENKNILPVFALLTTISQLNFSGLYLFLTTIIILILLKVRINFKRAFLGVLIGAIPAISYIFNNLFSTPFCQDCRALFSYSKAEKIFDLQHIFRPFQLLNGSYFDNPLGKDYSVFLNSFPIIKIFNFIFLIEFLIPVIGAILIYKYKREYLFLVLYILFIPLFYLLTKTPSYMYYYVIIIPAIILLSAIGFKISFDLLKNTAYKYLIISGFIFMVLINFTFEFYFYRFLNQRQVINGDYGPIFSKTKEFINKETTSYILFPYYDELKAYAYFYAYPEFLNGRLGYFFMQKGRADLAVEEFKKGINVNPKDIFSRANLAYIYILNNKIDEAKEQINILETDDATTAAKLKELITSKN